MAGKDLNRNNCNFLNAYYVVIKYNLFDCKPAVSMKLLQDQDKIKEKKESLVELRRQLIILEYLLENMKKIQQKANKKIMLEQIPEPQRSYFNQLMINNEHTKADSQKYYDDSFKKAFSILVKY